jgi:nitronate monooxygenase
MNFGGAKAWKEIWGSGQGIGAVTCVEPVAVKIDRLKAEYAAAKAAVA